MEQKIAVVGIGGIGGTLAYYLVKKYGSSVSLIARGKRAEALRERGVVLHSDIFGEVGTGPIANVGENGAEFGVQDLILVCVKNYSLESLKEQLKPMVSERTVIVPIMNGIEPGDKLRELFPEARVIDGLIYCNCTAMEDYSIQQRGDFFIVYVGTKRHEAGLEEAADFAAKLLEGADIETHRAENIETEIWRKYILNCAYNTMTARFNATSGELRRDPARVADYRKLMEEAKQVADKLGVPLPDGMLEAHMETFLHRHSENATSSLKVDVWNHRPTELDAFSGALLRAAKKFDLELPLTKEYYEALKLVCQENGANY